MNNGADVNLLRLKAAAARLRAPGREDQTGDLRLTPDGILIDLRRGKLTIHRLLPWLEFETARFDFLDYVIDHMEGQLERTKDSL